MQNSKFISYKDKQIHYRLFGTGKTVVLIHGFGEDGNIWKDLIKVLQNDFKLIIPDIPGSGSSEMLEGNVSIDDYADVIKIIIDKETRNDLPAEAQQSSTFPTASGGEIEGATMIGHSMGGYITLAFAEKYPDLLNAFGLFHSSAFADDEEKKQTRSKAIDFIKENGSYAFLKTAIPKLFAGDLHKKEMDQLMEKGKDFRSEALIQYYNAMINRPDRTGILKSFSKPILFIIGEKDSAIPLKSSLEQCHFPAKSYVNILDTGHMGMIEEPVQTSSIVKSFLQSI